MKHLEIAKRAVKRINSAGFLETSRSLRDEKWVLHELSRRSDNSLGNSLGTLGYFVLDGRLSSQRVDDMLGNFIYVKPNEKLKDYGFPAYIPNVKYGFALYSKNRLKKVYVKEEYKNSKLDVDKQIF